MLNDKEGELQARTFQTHAELRRAVHAYQESLVTAREESNPNFTDVENALGGVFLEDLEPQVRIAVLDLHSKGYATFTSGFDDFDPEYQMIGGTFTLEAPIVTQLEAMGVEVSQGTRADYGIQGGHALQPITLLYFRPDQPNIASIQRRWQEITAVIPQRPSIRRPV